MALGSLEHEVAFLGQQRLVGGDHMLAAGQCGQHPVQRGAGATHGLDHHVHVGVGGHGMGIGQHLHVRASQGLGPCHVACGHVGDHHVPSGAPGNGVVVAAQHGQRACPHSAQAQQADAKLGQPGRGRKACGWRGVKGERTVWHAISPGQKTNPAAQAGWFLAERASHQWPLERPPARSGGRVGNGGHAHSCAQQGARGQCQGGLGGAGEVAGEWHGHQSNRGAGVAPFSRQTGVPRSGGRVPTGQMRPRPPRPRPASGSSGWSGCG